MRDRLSDARGVSVVEVLVASSMLLVVTVPLLMSLTSAQRREGSAEELAQAVNEVRLVLDRMANEVREADGLLDAGTDDAFIAWYDADDDGTMEIEEFVTFALGEVAGETFLFRDDDAATSVMARGLTAASALSSADAVDGDIASIKLVINPDPEHAPGATTIETEVLARNA